MLDKTYSFELGTGEIFNFLKISFIEHQKRMRNRLSHGYHEVTIDFGDSWYLLVRMFDSMVAGKFWFCGCFPPVSFQRTTPFPRLLYDMSDFPWWKMFQYDVEIWLKYDCALSTFETLCTRVYFLKMSQNIRKPPFVSVNTKMPPTLVCICVPPICE